MDEAFSIFVDPVLSDLMVSTVLVLGVEVQPTGAELQAYAAGVIAQVLERHATAEFDQQCQQVRQMLRHGKFKASGRSKPAQEYLLRCVLQDGKLPNINGPVDLLNAVSLDINLPISLLSLRKCSRRLGISRGRAGDSFLFNSAGQSLDVTDLVVVNDCSGPVPRPVGSPIKDSLAGKIEAEDRELVAVIYSPNNVEAAERCRRGCNLLVDGFQRYCQATSSWIAFEAGRQPGSVRLG